MNHTPTVSIITGYYKRSAVVERTLRSLVNQSYKDIEIIVFDDASPDNTAQNIRDFIEATNDPRIVPIYHQTNVGFVAGLIDAISKAKGKYIAIQGSGDVSMPDRILKQKELLDSNAHLSVVGSHYENIIESTGVRRLRTPNANNVLLNDLLKMNVFTHGEVMFRRDIYELAGGYRPQFIFCQDYDLWLRMIQHGNFATVPEMLYQRYVDFEGVSYNPEKFIDQTRYSILAKQLVEMPAHRQADELSGLSRATLADKVPVTIPAMQKAVILAAIRAIIWGNFELANTLSNRYVQSTFVKSALKTITVIMKSCPFLHHFALRMTGSIKEKKIT